MSKPKVPPPNSTSDPTKTPRRPPAPLDKEPQRGAENDRAAANQSGIGSNGGQRDMTSGRHSGNQ